MDRVGVRWSKQENEQLMNLVYLKHTIQDIANQHKRNPGGIKRQILKNALLIMKDRKITIEQVSHLVNIPQYDIIRYSKYVDKQYKPEIDYDIKTDIQQIKNTLKELTEMITAIYVFEKS